MKPGHCVSFQGVTFPCASKAEAMQLMLALKQEGGKPLYSNEPLTGCTLTERTITLEADGSTSVHWYPLKDSQQENDA